MSAHRWIERAGKRLLTTGADAPEDVLAEVRRTPSGDWWAEVLDTDDVVGAAADFDSAAAAMAWAEGEVEASA